MPKDTLKARIPAHPIAWEVDVTRVYMYIYIFGRQKMYTFYILSMVENVY